MSHIEIPDLLLLPEGVKKLPPDLHFTPPRHVRGALTLMLCCPLLVKDVTTNGHIITAAPLQQVQ